MDIWTACAGGDVDLIGGYTGDLDARDASGESILHWACCYSQLEIVKLLIKKGVKVNVKCKDGKTPLAEAASQGCFEIVRLLVYNGAKDPYALRKAVDSLDFKTCKFLVDSGWDVNRAGSDAPPLIAAINRHNLRLVRLFLDNGGDVNLDYFGTPLHFAAVNRHANGARICKLLIDRGAIIDTKGGFDGLTPLHAAAKVANLCIVELLLENGADPYIKNRDHKTVIDVLGGKAEVLFR